MNRHPDIRVTASREVHRGRVFAVLAESLLLPSGRRQDVELVVHGGAVCVAPLLDTGELLLVRQYRHATGEWLVEIPAGRVEPGEERARTAERELEEETGHRAASIELLREFYAAPGFCSEWMSLYVARGLRPIEGQRRAADPDEELELVRMRPAELLRAARDAKTLVAASLLLLGAGTSGT